MIHDIILSYLLAEDERLELPHAFTWTVFRTEAVPIMLNPPYSFLYYNYFTTDGAALYYSRKLKYKKTYDIQ